MRQHRASPLPSVVLSRELDGRDAQCEGELPHCCGVGATPAVLEQTHGVGGDASYLGQLLLAERRAPPHGSECGEWYAPGLTLLWVYLP